MISCTTAADFSARGTATIFLLLTASVIQANKPCYHIPPTLDPSAKGFVTAVPPSLREVIGSRLFRQGYSYRVLHTYAAQNLRFFWQNDANHHNFGEAGTIIFQLAFNAVPTNVLSSIAITVAFFIWKSLRNKLFLNIGDCLCFSDCSVSIMPTTGDVIAMGSILPILDLMAVALRFFAKHKKTRCGVDDYLMLFSLIVSLALGAIMIFGAVKFGYGQNSPGPTAESGFVGNSPLTINTNKLTVIFSHLQILTLGTIKLSVLFFYRQIFRGTTFDILSWAMICIVTAMTATTFLLALFQCGIHIKWLWSSPTNIAAYCLAGTKLASAFAILDVITDILIILMPLYWIWNLHMSRMRRLLISGTFLFGALAVIASAARLIVVMLVYPSHNLSPNQLGFCTDVVYFTMLEVGLTIIAACLPTFGSLFSDSFKGRLQAAVRRFYTSLPRFRFSFSSINHTAMVNHSETRSAVGDSTSSRMGLETVATAEKNREVNEPQGQIRVTTATNRYSCTAEKFV